jgi:hypothetical protein
MLDDIEAAALRAQIEVIIKEAEDVEAQAVVASRPPASSRSPRPQPWSRWLQLSVSACHLCLHRHLQVVTVLNIRQLVVPIASSTYEDTVVVRLHLQAAAGLNVRQLVNIVL